MCMDVFIFGGFQLCILYISMFEVFSFVYCMVLCLGVLRCVYNCVFIVQVSILPCKGQKRTLYVLMQELQAVGSPKVGYKYHLWSLAGKSIKGS